MTNAPTSPADRSGLVPRLATLHSIFLRLQVSRGRAAGIGAFVVLFVLLGLANRGLRGFERIEAIEGLIDVIGIQLFVPIVVLVSAGATLGDLVEDESLVHLWLRPVPRWAIPLGAALASLTVTLPLTVLTLVGAAIAVNAPNETIVAAGVAAAIGAIGYTGPFVWLGLTFRRSLLWGIAFIVAIESALTAIGGAASRLTIRTWPRRHLQEAAGFDLDLPGTETFVSVLIVIAVTIAGIALATWTMSRREVA